VYVCSPLRKGWAVRLWWAGCYKGRAGRCGFGRQGVTNGIRADPRGCVYGSVCGHRVHGACGPGMGHMAWHMGQHWMYGRALRGKVSEPTLAVAHTGQCADIGCMARVGLGWDTRHGIWVGTGRTVVR
jgi:hypothetical protein